jgi:hypothetical protein
MEDIELKFKDLCDWITQNGGYVNPKLNLINTGNYGNAIIASDDIQNEDLFSIPKSIHLNPENSKIDFSNTDFSFKEQVVISLLKELFTNDSFYLPYLELLPKLESFENHPIVLFMNGKFPRVSEFIYERASINYQEFVNFNTKFLEFNRKNSIFSNLKLQGILWAYLNVTTRMWTKVGLVPLADLLQHSNESTVALDITDEYSKMRTEKLITTNSIVYDNYLIEDDISLYLNFGFVDSSNLHHTSLNFRFDRKPGLLSNIIESELSKNSFKITISSEGINQNLISFLRINMLSEKDIRNIDFNNPEYYKNIISVGNELRCLKKLKLRMSHLLNTNEINWVKSNIDTLQDSTEKDICKLLLKLESIQISIERLISEYWLSFLNNTDN